MSEKMWCDRIKQLQVRQVFAADRSERRQVRKVRAPQGRTPDNVRWRRLQGKCNRNIPPGDFRDSATEINRRLLAVRVERQCKRLPPAW